MKFYPGEFLNGAVDVVESVVSEASVNCEVVAKCKFPGDRVSERPPLHVGMHACRVLLLFLLRNVTFYQAR